ncbi:MAG: hypothetical protein ACKN9U_20395 [Pirellulaceae bacterium]|jgi:hypothetical protein
MKRGYVGILLAAVTMVASTGCNILHRNCNACRSPIGCRPCSIGWQRGGTDYGNCLGSHSHPQGLWGHQGHGLGGHGLGGGHLAGMAGMAGAAHPPHPGEGPPSGIDAPQVAYPYYTVRGPRDYFLDDPAPLGR